MSRAASEAIPTSPDRIAVELPDFALPDELPSDPVALKTLMRRSRFFLLRSVRSGWNAHEQDGKEVKESLSPMFCDF